MTCVKFDITVSNDNADGKLKKAVFQAATNNGSLDFTKATILAGYINNDPKFIELLKQTLSERGKQFTSLLDTHANVISEVLNDYYEQNHLSVENFIAKQHAEALSGFTTSNAKREAIEHTADQILAVYDSEFQKPKQKRMSYAEILEEVKSRIKSTFTNEVFNPLLDILNTNEFKDKPKIKEYLERYETARKKAIDAQKAFKDAKANNLEDSEINKLSEELTTKMSTYRAVQENIINDFTELTKLKSGAAKNYLNLVNLISGSNNWFYTAFTSSKLTNIVRDFETVLEEEKVEATDATDELDFNNIDTNTIDETARSWEDKLYNNFDKHVDARLKLYLSRLFNLSSPDKVVDNKTGIGRFPKDNTTELGVPMTMHATYCIAQMSVNCNFSSLEGFINSVEKLARKNKKLYGLMQLVEDMRNDESLQWAKFVRSQLDNPKIQKRMIILKEDGAEVIHSNKAMDPLTLLIYNMQNSAKATIRSKHYDVLKSQLVDRKLKISKLTDTSTDAAIGIHFDFVYNWLTTYFPTIDKNSIRNYVYENKATRSKKIKDLVNYLDTFVAAAEKIRESTTEVPDYSVMDSAIINIAKELVNYSVAKIELNSANAEGNMASDLIKNSYLTNLIKQIEHVDENGFPVGLQNLGNFLAQGEQFRHNPILFGIHRNGIDEPGMFTLNEDGTVIVNEGAKDLIQISLFDGTKDQINANAAMYTGMSKGDYFLTSLLVFNNAIDPSGIYSEGVDNYKKTFGGFFLRTPSDAPKNFIIQTKKYSIDGLWANKDKTTINRKNRLYNAFYNHVYGEINNFVQNLNNVFEYINGEWVSKDNTDLLIDRAHYNITYDDNGNPQTIVQGKWLDSKKTKSNPNAGELSGNFFKFLKLFNTNGYNASEAIKNALSLYGGDNAVLSSYKSKNVLKLNLTNAPYLTTENNRIKLVETKALTESLENILDNWINNFVVEIENKTTQYQTVIEGKYSSQDVIAAMLNNAVMDMSFDDIFEGDVKYYKDAQDFLKRAKEVQAGGKSYDNTDLNNAIGGTIHDANNLHNASYTIKINGRDTGIKVRNGFRAVTIKNTIRPSGYAEDIKNELKSILSKQMSAEQAEKISNEIAAGYSDPTKTNDAQSYITFEEWIARKEAEGTLDKYTDIIEQIYEVREGKRDLKDIDLKNIIARIQVQKNFYFDKQYDANTGCFYPRQIKNAEFVIIPELVKGTDLETLYNIMRKYDIGQINTAETDKAAKRSVLEFWDNNGVAYPEEFESSLYNDKVIENYYYRYLYKQQDVPQHLVDERNKAGIQILKKILDNATPEVKNNINNLMKNYVANIKDDFRTLLNNMGWKFNENGVLVNIKNNNQTLDFIEFYKRARIEAQRLGMDSNFIEYLTPDILGEPSMPNYMNNVATKLESIAQSLFNNAITRQTLPGWHAAQVTGVGHGTKVLDSEGNFRKLKYHPKNTVKKLTINDFNKVLDIYKKTDNTYTELAEAVFTTCGKVGIKIKKASNEDLDGFSIGGDFHNGYIRINENVYELANKSNTTVGKIILHEAIHALTTYAIDNKSILSKSAQDAVTMIEACYQKLIENENKGLWHFDADYYGLKNSKEMIAELSNPEFRKVLKKYNLIQKITDAIKEILKNLFDRNNITIDNLDIILENSLYTLINEFNENGFIQTNKNKIGLKYGRDNLTKIKLKKDTFEKVMALEEDTKEFTIENDIKNTVLKDSKKGDIIKVEFPIGGMGFSEILYIDDNKVILSLEDSKTVGNKIIDKYNLDVNIFDYENEAYVEVLLPRWSNLIPKGHNISKLAEEGLDIHIGYRIPTEGKQSVSVLKVVGFLDDVYGSTIMVPDEWVTQTGSDFDVDSVYGICYEMFKDIEGNLRIIKPDTDESIEAVERRYCNYITRQLESKISKQEITDEFIKDKTKELYQTLQDENARARKSNNKAFRKAYNNYEDSLNELPDEDYKELENIEAKYGKGNAWEKYNEIATVFASKPDTTTNEKLKGIYLEVMDAALAMADIVGFTKEKINENYKKFREERSEKVKELYLSARREYVDDVKVAAKESNLVSFEEFSKWSIEEQQSRRARNNEILKSMIDIMSHENSREENYSRSNFDDLTNALKKTKSLIGSQNVERSAYNPFDQIDFFENAVSGRKLKAFSVTRDTFNSICNFTKARLGKEHYIKVTYDLSTGNYNVKNLEDTFGKNNVSHNTENNTVTVTHTRIGNSNGNRNVVGKLLTVYSSQTTAHILDAIKEGAIPNENEFTFGTFKTLIDVGMDYETAIAFLMQPAITRVVEAYNENNSVYLSSTANPINTAIKRIAKDLGLTIKGKAITDYDSMADVRKAINDSQDLKDAFNKVFWAEFNPNKPINEQSFNIDAKLLNRRLKLSNSANNFTSLPDKNTYEVAAFDIATILIFEKLHETTKNIEAIARCAKPDSFGAKQTIRATRKVKEFIVKYITDKGKPIANTIQVGDTDLLSSIYPGIETDRGIDVDKSSYGYLAAFFKYATETSVAANSQLFKTESEQFVDITNAIENKLGGKNLSEEQYKELKQYMVQKVYRSIPLLTTPITLNEFGLITYDIDRIKEIAEAKQPDPNTVNLDDFNELIKFIEKDYWENEKYRIFGYSTKQSLDFPIKDINNPTKEEIDAFNKLTPAQKVIWMQQNFKENAGLFEYIYPNMFNQNEARIKGYSTQTLKFNDQIDNIEELFVQFNNAFFNKNPLVRLAAIDLIKYSFVVEGFKFKKGSISKIITNKAMQSDLNQKGMAIIPVMKESMNTTLNMLDSTRDEFIERFIRSHSEIVKEVNIPFGSSIEKEFKTSMTTNTRNLVYIPYTSQKKNLLEFITLGAEDTKDYIRITRSINKQRKTILYKVKNTKNGVYLIPLNLLERNETDEISVNNNNNLYPRSKFYDAIINHATRNDVVDLTIYEDTNSENYSIYREYLSAYTIPKNKYEQANEFETNIDYLIKLTESKDIFERDSASKFINDVNKVLDKNPLPGTKNIIYNPSRIIANKVIKGNNVIQHFPTGEEVRTVNITRVDAKKNFKYLDDRTKAMLEKDRIKYPNLYQIELVTEADVKEEYLNKLKTNKEAAIVNYSITSPLDDVDLNDEYDYQDIDKVSKKMVEHIQWRHRSGIDENASNVVRQLNSLGIDFKSGVSLESNRKNIYELAAEYFRRKSINLQSQLEEFTTIAGDKFAINDPELYKYLRTHPDDYFNLVDVIIEAKTFGDVFKEILDTNISSSDPLTQKYIDEIRNAINKVRNNNKLVGKKGAMDLLFNDYIANNFSTNPLIRNNFIKLTDQFGDVDWWDLNLSDIGEVNHKQIQTIVKLVSSILNEATSVLAPKEVADFNKKYDTIMAMPESYNENNIITKDGRLIQIYTDNFIEDKYKFANAARDAEMIYGRYSKEHFEAKLANDKWKLENLEQEVNDNYYRQKIALEERTYKACQHARGNDFLEYLKIRDELYKDHKDFRSLTPDEKAKHEELLSKMQALKSDIIGEIDRGELKDDEGRDRSRAIANYEKGIKKLNSDYFEYDERIGFRDTLEYFNKIIKNYEKAHPNETLDMRLKDPTYREAYDWIYANTIYKLSEDAEKALKAAYGYFMPNTDGKKSGNSTVTTILNNNNAYDRYGYIDPRGLSLDDIAKIKASYELDFVSNYNSTVEKVNFIKSIPKDLPIYNDTFYEDIRHPSEFTSEVQKRKNELAKIINKLIVKGLDNNGDLSTEILFNNLSKDELKQLADAYKELKSLKETRKKDKVYNEKLKSLIDSGKITFIGDDNPVYIKNITWFNSQSNNLTTEQKQLWFDIFTEEDYKGNTVANSDIFGYIEAAPEYINYERTEAKKLIENNIIYKPTEYYYDMMDKMSKLGKDKYEEWFDLNHIYNPKMKAWEPLRIWTRREVNPNGSLKGSYSQIATYDNTNRKIADGMENSNYKPYTANYKIKPNESGIDTNKYANSKYTSLSKKERAMHELLQTTLNFYTIDNESASHIMKSFVERGYLPRRAKYEPDAKYYISQALGSVGLEFRETGETEWTQYMDYAHDRDINFDMLKNLKQKGYQEQLPIPERNEGENNADYEKRIKDIRDKNKEIREANAKLEQEILDRDWKGVMNDFITKSIEYNARNKAKNSIYLLLEDLKTRGAYDLSNYNKVPIKDNRGSVKESAEYQTISQKNAIGITENWMRRIIYGQFKKTQRFTKYADLIQNITSAKYMIFNVTGGIANIGTGVANIFNEVFANKYFNMTDWGIAQREYFSNSLNIIADMYKPTSNNETAALLKMFDIVNFDDFNERRTNESASEYTKRIRESLYFMQSSGEHYMQNTALLAMLNSHRIFKDIDGTPKVGSFNDYIWNIEIDTMKKLLQENRELYQSYVNFIKEETKDIKNIQKYDSLQVDFNATFLRRNGDKNLIKKYIAARKEAVKNAKTEFNKAPLLREQFSLTDGVITIKPDSELTGRMFGEFKEKVKQTNKLIHGVYDKIGAAKIESEWWGGLVMQYHKHIYPGILKRWRNRGMYNELRESPEKGSYNILGMYLSTEFREAYKRIKDRKENQDNVAIASIQEIVKAAIDTALNLRLNYNLLPIWEQNAMKRCLGDLLGVTSAFLIAIAIHMATDDDEIQENDFYATVLYMADRLNSEAQMYTPWGLWTEASTLWSSPIAAQNGPKDLIKGLSIGIQALYDEDFNINYTTGLYKGQNKLAVLLYRNTPIYRVYQRLSTMDKNNSYYRINETAFNIKFAKTIADTINPD